MSIPQEQIAVKTSKVDDLRNVELMSPDCEIRYIITVNALKEGWDCPFAYILASLANKTSKVDVEQILGRILRQPYAKQHTAPLLNTSYVLTSSSDFRATLDSIVEGLNKSGFSRKDYRVTDEFTLQETAQQPEPVQIQEPLLKELPQRDDTGDDDSFDDVDPIEIRQVLVESDTTESGSAEPQETNSGLTDMIAAATAQAAEYTSGVNDTGDDGFTGGELGEMLNQNTIQEQYQEEVRNLKIPQFYIKSTPDLFGNEYELLEPENLSEGFSLSGQDAQVSFELATGEMYRVDIQEQGEAVPKYKRASKSDSEYIREYLESMPPESRIRQCASMIASQINRNDRYAASDVEEYVRRVVDRMTEDELAAMETSIPVYSRKIQTKISELEEAYRSEMFRKWIDSGKIVCCDSYVLDNVITPSDTIESIPYSLYEAEKNDMNRFERNVLDVIVGTDDIHWWHRVIERKDFRINGYFNHYPDFIIMTKSGKLILIEAKGDYLDGDDSKAKLELGRKWQEQAGHNYRYFMVFENKELGMDGAYTLDKFADIMKEI